VSPLRARTAAQAEAVGHALGAGWRVAVGMKHADPFVEDAVRALAAAGAHDVVALVLAPHFSALSVGEYLDRAAAAGAEAGVRVHGVRSWHLEPAFVDALAARVAVALRELPEGAEVLFTAHSLPARVLESGDPYPDQVRETAAAVAARVGLRDGRWSTGWQSAGRTPEPWLGPDVLDEIRVRAARGATGLLVCPAGFTADHLEVLYDLDVDAARVAAEVGLPFARTESLNDDPSVCAALADVARRAAGAG
jgi:ferrochelatase